MNTKATLILAILIVASPLQAATSMRFRIVPGERLGSVVLDESPDAAARLLGKPSYVRRLGRGLVIETWLSHGFIPLKELSAGDANRKRKVYRHYYSVFFKQRRAVQIEATSPQFSTAGGLSINNSTSLKWQVQYKVYQTIVHTWLASSPDMDSPACKHIMVYGDAIGQGIAWKSGAWGCLAPDPGDEAEAIVVHRRGHKVLLNPEDADDYAGRALPGT